MIQVDLEKLIGQKFNKLTIQKAWKDENNKIQVHVKCECGNKKDVLYYDLKSSRVKTCGQCNKIDLNSLIGKKYGRLTIISAERKKKGSDKDNHIYVQAECECGNIVERRLSALTNNDVVPSCGCLRQEKLSINLEDLIGKQIGKFTIIKAERKNKRIYVQAKCECGNVQEYYYQSLLRRKNQCCNQCASKSNALINLKELIGKKYGKLTIIDAFRNDKSEIRAVVECECGEKKEVRFHSLANGDIVSCGQCKKINLNDLIGQKYGKLTIIKAKYKNHSIIVTAKCECGSIKDYRFHSLKSGHTKSCGCIKADRLNNIWHNLLDQCYNELSTYYIPNINICDEWLKSFEAFKQWVLANNYSGIDKFTINRIDANGDFCPDNCYLTSIVSDKDQVAGLIEINGEKHTVKEWCEKNNINYGTYKTRKRHGMDTVKALTMPVK